MTFTTGYKTSATGFRISAPGFLPSAPGSVPKLGMMTRRAFSSGAAALLLAPMDALGQAGPATGSTQAGTATRPDVAAIDHDRILAAATAYIEQTPTPLTSLPCPRSPGTVHDYYSEAEGGLDNGAAVAAPNAAGPLPVFTAHRDALFQLGLQVGALSAAGLLTGEGKYAERAALHLRAWFVDAATRMTPRLEYGQVLLAPSAAHVSVETNTEMGRRVTGERASGTFAGILETLPLIEVAQAIPFLAATSAFSAADLDALHQWFADYLQWLTVPEDSGPRLAALARDRKDHHGTSWLLQACAYSRLTSPEGSTPKSESAAMAALRQRFKRVTLRAQIAADGTCPHELNSTTPLRDSLFNLDMLAAICDLLTTRFENVWDYQLEDGPGMRSAIAYHFPFMADRGRWPFRADLTHFAEMPSRRLSLLFAAKAYQRPEYAALWKTLRPDPPSLEVLRTIPIHQPLLWVRQAPRAG